MSKCNKKVIATTILHSWSIGQVCFWIFSSENRVTRFRKIYEWHVYEGGIFGILNFIMYINWLIWCNKYITDITKWLLLHWQSYVYNTEITERRGTNIYNQLSAMEILSYELWEASIYYVLILFGLNSSIKIW